MEKTKLFHSELAPETFAEGQYQINRVQILPRMWLYALSITPFYLGVGDYHSFIVNFPKELIIGSSFIPL